MSSRLDTTRPELLFVTSAISLYVGAAIAVSWFDQVPAATVGWLRVLAAGLMVVAARRSWRRSWTQPQLLTAAGFGIVLASMNVIFYMAADRLNLGSGVAIEFIGPVLVAALGVRTRRNTMALAFAVAGIALLSGVSGGGERVGVVLALIAGLLWGGYIVLASRNATSGASVDGLGVGMLLGGLAVSPFGIAGLDAVANHPMVLVAVAAIGLLANAIPYGLDQIVLRRLPAERFALLLALLPATATVIGAVLLAQIPSPAEVGGIALVMVGVALRDRSGEKVSPAVAS